MIARERRGRWVYRACVQWTLATAGGFLVGFVPVGAAITALNSEDLLPAVWAAFGIGSGCMQALLAYELSRSAGLAWRWTLAAGLGSLVGGALLGTVYSHPQPTANLFVGWFMLGACLGLSQSAVLLHQVGLRGAAWIPISVGAWLAGWAVADLTRALDLVALPAGLFVVAAVEGLAIALVFPCARLGKENSSDKNLPSSR